MNNNPYKSFPKFVLRTPLLPLNFYLELTSGEMIPDKVFHQLFNDPIIQEAIFLASPPFYEELERWSKGEVKDRKKAEKLKYSFLKYLSRMSSRCTPFGLFAGCSVGGFGNTTQINLHKREKNGRCTRLDMNYLVALSQDIAKIKNIKEQLLFYPNSSIYRAGEQLRYIEYKYIHTKRQHEIVAVDTSEYLDKVLQKASKGALLRDLVDVVADDQITPEEALGFVEELVDSQLLISELEPSVSGPAFLGQLCMVLRKLQGTSSILTILDKTVAEIEKIDDKIGNPPKKYTQISKLLKGLTTDFEMKYLFQTDMITTAKKNKLSVSVIDSVKKGFSLLNKITLPPQDTFLAQFKNAFYERFEEREVPLSRTLDVEMGIGYKQDQDTGGINPLIDKLIIPGKGTKHSIKDIKWSSIDSIFQKKMIGAFTNKDYSILLTDEDFKDFEEDWKDLPDTISAIIEIVKIEGKEKIKFNGGGGSGAANLFGRFCHGDAALEEHTKKIIETETHIHKDKIVAEIVHLPESRIGNILMRPAFRGYEIPYLARSVVEDEKQLAIEDLWVSVKHNKDIFLRSKKYNKEVIPRLTTAHNYSSNSLPIYHFLCDMQTQGLRGWVGLNLGPFANEYDFIPRIEYEDLILHEATWNIKKQDIEPLQKLVKESNALKAAVNVFRKNKKIPQLVVLTDGDNELLVNFKNLTSVKMLLKTVKNRSEFKIKEFLFSEDGIVKGNDGKEYYTNQMVLSFYNSEKAGQILTTPTQENG